MNTQSSALLAFAEKKSAGRWRREACGPGGAIEGLLQGAGGGDRKIEAVMTVVGAKVVYARGL